MEKLSESNAQQIRNLLSEEEKSFDTAAENIRLKNWIAELEQQLENAKNYSRMLESEINDINNKYMVVLRTNAELKKKLAEVSE